MDEIRQVSPDDDSLAEEWIRTTDDEDVLGVDATRWREAGDWPWQVGVSAAEFVVDEPLESQLRAAVDAALRSVAGVAGVAEEDREIWIVQGTPTGHDLVRAVAAALDGLAGDIRSYLDEM